MVVSDVAGSESQSESELYSGTIKWFDTDKGFGFIAAREKEEDILLHISALKKSGHYYPYLNYEGIEVRVRAHRVNAGLRCSLLVWINLGSLQLPGKTKLRANAADVMGPERMSVKFLDNERGFGFFEREGDSDVFFHCITLRACGIDPLRVNRGDSLFVSYGPNEKDPSRRLMAVSISRRGD